MNYTNAFIDGHTISLHQADAHIILGDPLFERYASLIRCEVNPGDFVIDIGAHVGTFTLTLASAVGPSGKVIAFEPEPTNFELLKRNIAANGYSWVATEQKAISHSSRQNKLYICKENSGMHRLYPSITCEDSLTVDQVSLDQYLKDAGLEDCPVSFVKIDIEGAEYLALQGMQRLLSKKRKPKLFMEFCAPSCVEAGVSPGQLLTFLEQSGYTLYAINDTLEKIDSFSLSEQMKNIEPKLRSLLSNLTNNKKNLLQELDQIFIDELNLLGYHRPLVENIFCIVEI